MKSQIANFSDITNSAFFASLSEGVTFEEAYQRIIFDDVRFERRRSLQLLHWNLHSSCHWDLQILCFHHSQPCSQPL